MISDFDVQFDPVAHAYKIDGKPVPSVTQVLKILDDYSNIPPDVLEVKRKFGQHVHSACALLVRRNLVEETLHPSIVPYITGFKNFMRDSKAIVLASELVVAHPEFGYAGTLDLDVMMNNCLGQVDIKTGIPPWTVPQQTAAYEVAYARTFGVSRAKNRKRWALHLCPSFPLGYKLNAITGRTDFNLFLSALNVWQAKKAHETVDSTETTAA